MAAPLGGSRLVLWLEERLDRVYRRRILSQPMAKAFSLSAYADAESSGENQVFERALSRCRDERVATLIRRHQADEIRHAAMFERRRDALGLPALPVPSHLKLIDQLSRACGDVLDRPMTTDDDVAAVYALLYVLEERAVEEFDRAERMLVRLGDEGTAAVFRDVAADERRHLKYCRAVGLRYDGSPEAFAARVQAMRAVEAEVYGAQTRAFLRWMIDRGWLDLGPAAALLRGLVGLADGLRVPAPRLSGPLALALP